jgi:hypothetical protein
MDIKVLGTGCANCKNTIALIEQVAKDKGVAVTLAKVEDLREIMGYGVMSHAGRGDRRQGGARRRRAQPRQGRTVAGRLNPNPTGTHAMNARVELPPAREVCPTTTRRLLAEGALLVDVRERAEVARMAFDVPACC